MILFLDTSPHLRVFGNKPHDKMSLRVRLMGNRALQHWLNAIYSASVELSAISVCSLLDQCIGTPARTIMKPVLDRHESRK